MDFVREGVMMNFGYDWRYEHLSLLRICSLHDVNSNS